MPRFLLKTMSYAIGSARIARPGRDATIVAWGSTVPLAVQAATALAGEGVDVEVIDLRSLAPWDAATVLGSVSRTRRLVIAHEAWVAGGFGAEVAATVAGHLRGGDLLAPIMRVGAEPVPIPSGPLRARALPTMARLMEAIRTTIHE